MKSLLQLALLFVAAVVCASPAESGTQAMTGDLARYEPKPYVRIQPPAWTKDAALYQVNLRQFTPKAPSPRRSASCRASRRSAPTSSG